MSGLDRRDTGRARGHQDKEEELGMVRFGHDVLSRML